MPRIHISPLILHDYFHVFLFANEYLANKELVVRPPCFRVILQPPITDSLLFASL
jgi:hypothetical protein